MSWHQGQEVVRAGVPLAQAKNAIVMVHGRGSEPGGILAISSHLRLSATALLAPGARGGTWYPQRFLAPRQANEPYLSSALQAVGQAVESARAAGIPYDRIMLLGFSQGACLALEYAARNPAHYWGVVGLSGGVIGADSELTGYQGDMAQTPVFLGCSNIDMHIPVERVYRTVAIFNQLNAEVTTRIYPNFGHAINMDEIENIQAMLDR